MAAPFGQTIRSLDADRGYGRDVALVVFSLLLIGWLVWLFAARFPARLVSEPGQLLLDNTLTVEFSGEGIDKLEAGQPGLILLSAPPLPEALILPVVVNDVTFVGGTAQVVIVPDFSLLEGREVGPEILSAFVEPTPGQVQIEVERVSPLTLVLRAAGMTEETAPVFVTP